MDADRNPGQQTAPDFATPLSSANDAQFDWGPPPLRTLVLDDGATRIQRESEDSKRDEIWHGVGFCLDRSHLQWPPDEYPVYVRLADRKSLIAEIVCGRLAHALRLPAPEVFVVIIPPGTLRGSRLAPENEDLRCIGTRDMEGGAFSQFLSEAPQQALALLRDWPEFGKVAAFDEWVANPDRNLGNLIYARQTLHIIDHADALGGGARAKHQLAELTDIQFDNILADLAANAFQQDRVVQLLADMQRWLVSCDGTCQPQAVVPEEMPDLMPEAERQELIAFIARRLKITYAMLCHRLGHPQLPLPSAA